MKKSFIVLWSLLLCFGLSHSETLLAGRETPNPSQFASIDAYARKTPVSMRTSIAKLATYLAKGAKNDLEKHRAIYIWITENIQYDTVSYFSGDYGDNSAEGVLRTGLGVCAGYSRLYKALADEMGLTAVTVMGFAKGYGYDVSASSKFNPNHDWNAIKLDGKWYLIDSTWGAGIINDNARFEKKYKEFYFLTPPELFLTTHYPKESKWQLVKKPVSYKEFLSMISLDNDFYRLGLSIVSPKTSVVKAKSDMVVTLTAPKDVICIATLFMEGAALQNMTFVVRDNDKIRIHCHFPEEGEYKLQIYGKKKNEAGSYPSILEYNVVASAGKGELAGFPKTYGIYTERDVKLTEPLNLFLRIGKSYNFKVTVPNAEEVSVVIGGNWTPLKKNGSTFSGSVKITDEQIGIYAKFPGNTRFDGIASYIGY